MFDEQSDTWPPIERSSPEATRVEDWRLHVLVEAGYPVDLAEQLAREARDVDLHQAVDLVAGGCTPQLAAAILL